MGILQIVVVFTFITVSGAFRCNSLAITPWGSWGSCSKTCGGGLMTRVRCYLGRLLSRSENCNQWCYNGAPFISGECKCDHWRDGTCCLTCRHITISQCMPGRQSCGGSPDGIKCTQCYDPFYSAGYHKGCQACPDIAYCTDRYCTTVSNTKCRECIDDLKRYKRTHSDTRCQRMCAWDNQYCWPGHCDNDLTTGCSCSKDFRKIQTSTETSCQPAKPAPFVKCDTHVIGKDGKYKDSNTGGSSTACRAFQEFYGHFIPSLLQYDLEGHYSIDLSGYTPPSYIHEYKFGITDVIIYIKQKYLNGSIEARSQHAQYADPTLTRFVNFTMTNSGRINVSTSFHSLHDGESLCFEYESYAGGYLKSKNLLTQKVNAAVNYQKVKSSQTVCYNFDDTPPKHCKEDGNCETEPLKVVSAVTRSPFNMVTYTEWFDPIPKGGKAAQASGIKTFTINVNRILSTKGHLKVDYSTMYMKTMNNASTAASVYLKPDRPTLYVIKLAVEDNAGNVKQARRFLLFDNTSFIETIKHRPLLVTSASTFNNLYWQTNNLDICLSWRNRYLNRFYVDGELLSASHTAQDVIFTGVYEQTQGLLSVYGTPNVFGIIKFLLSVYINDKMYFEDNEIPDFENQTYCGNFNTTDGERYEFEVKPVDIAGNTYAENITVYIDKSGPVLDIVSLTVKDDENKSSIQLHSSEDTVQFEARDPHSGISSITWQIGISYTNLKIATGTIDVKHLHVCPNDTRKCYCSATGSCQRYDYDCPLGQLVCDDRVVESARRDLYLSLEVINNAMLSSKEVIRLSIDSAYVTGQCKSSSKKVQEAIAGGVSTGFIVALLCVAVIVYWKREYIKDKILLRQHNRMYEDLENEQNSVTNNTYCMTLVKKNQLKSYEILDDTKRESAERNDEEVTAEENSKKQTESYEDIDAKQGPTEQQKDTEVSAEENSKLRTESYGDIDAKQGPTEQQKDTEVSAEENSKLRTESSEDFDAKQGPTEQQKDTEVSAEENSKLRTSTRKQMLNLASICSDSASYEDLDAKRGPTEQQYETVSADKGLKPKPSLLRIFRAKFSFKSGKENRRSIRATSNIYEDIKPQVKKTDRMELKPPAPKATNELATTSTEKAIAVTPPLLPNLPEVALIHNETTFDLHIPERVKLPRFEQEECSEEHTYDNTVLKPSEK